MSLLWKLVTLLLATCLVESANTKHAKRDQVVMSSSPNPRLSRNRHSAEGSVLVNVTFDAIDLSKQANRSLDSVPFVDFEKFQVVNSTAAMKSGMLNESDWNCAESSPNFILSIPSEYTAPSIFHTNDKKLSAAGLSKYVDLVSFTIKPLRSNAEFGGVDIAAWEVDGKHADNVHELYLGFFKDEDTNAFNPFPIAPRDYFEGWGEKVNWIEMSAYTINDEDNLTPWEFCLDNIVFEVREKRDDE